SYIFKEDTRGERYSRILNSHFIVYSFMTLAELRFWALSRNWGAVRRRALHQFLANLSLHSFNSDLIDYWAAIKTEARGSGCSIKSSDAWIAATALQLETPLLTNNPKDFVGLKSIELIDG